MTPPSTGDLPNDGDIVEFTEVPAASQIRTPVVPIRYRVEHKAGAGDYLLIDTASGHSFRIPTHELKSCIWKPAAPAELEKRTKVEGKTEASLVAKPLSDSGVVAPPGSTG